MSNNEQILNCLFGAIDELNSQRSADNPLEKSADTAIAGANAAVDSLEYLNFVLAVETQLSDAFGASCNLAETLVGGEDSPETLGQLVTRIAQIQESTSGEPQNV
jgi:hypothetical protein